MSWITNEMIVASAALLFAIVLGASVVNGLWQSRDRSRKGPDST